MVLTKVFQSTHLERGEYDEERQALKITFTDGSTYVSDELIPAKVWADLTRSISPGTYFSSMVSPYWKGRKLK